MNEALLVIASMCMMNFAGGVPKPLLDHTWTTVGGERIVRHLDERYLNEDIRLYGGHLALGAQIISQQKIVIRVDF